MSSNNTGNTSNTDKLGGGVKKLQLDNDSLETYFANLTDKNIDLGDSFSEPEPTLARPGSSSYPGSHNASFSDEGQPGSESADSDRKREFPVLVNGALKDGILLEGVGASCASRSIPKDGPPDAVTIQIDGFDPAGKGDAKSGRADGGSVRMFNGRDLTTCALGPEGIRITFYQPYNWTTNGFGKIELKKAVPMYKHEHDFAATVSAEKRRRQGK
ncbi:hypothetical protein QFC20_002844 [Naganishia adeliensis]|uniref:Uncharacterized protein n=1 Tax=Naganishia adeliensis TaxID=92952 RepID=A0ACC2WI75_9TREE|nr:hypothetical protein QFC20_002844 [Naganishia adeliensis]